MGEEQILEAFVQALAQAPQNQGPRTGNPFVIALGIIMVAAYLVKNFGPYFRGKVNGSSTHHPPTNNETNGMIKDVHTIITQKNGDGLPIIQTIPREMRKLANSTTKLTEVVDRLHKEAFHSDHEH